MGIVDLIIINASVFKLMQSDTTWSTESVSNFSVLGSKFVGVAIIIKSDPLYASSFIFVASKSRDLVNKDSSISLSAIGLILLLIFYSI